MDFQEETRRSEKNSSSGTTSVGEVNHCYMNVQTNELITNASCGPGLWGRHYIRHAW